MQEELEVAEGRLQRKEKRHADVVNIQRDALIKERNKNIDMMKATGLADAVTTVEGDLTKGVGIDDDGGVPTPWVVCVCVRVALRVDCCCSLLLFLRVCATNCMLLLFVCFCCSCVNDSDKVSTPCAWSCPLLYLCASCGIFLSLVIPAPFSCDFSVLDFTHVLMARLQTMTTSTRSTK